MQSDRDPVEWAAGSDRDLQEVVTWEPRSALDRVATAVHASLRPIGRALLVLAAATLVVALLASGLLSAITDPTIQVLVVVSVVPALLLVTYVWLADVTTEPLTLLVATLVLGVLFAPFAGVVNSTVQNELLGWGIDVRAGLASVLYFFLIVAVGEESVKLLAVRLYAYRHPRFDAVVDGAVYGAVAGLGFALIENTLYITAEVGGAGGLTQLGAVTALRALAGPGHVIYSGLAGYYLGLAKFNQEHAGPLVVKGLVVGAVVHGGYNTLVSFVPGLLVGELGVSPAIAVVGFIFAYDSVAGYLLYRKIHAYRDAFDAVYPRHDVEDPDPDLTEFDRGLEEAPADD